MHHHHNSSFATVQLQFMKLSFGVALAGLIFVEYLRLGKIAPLGTRPTRSSLFPAMVRVELSDR